MKRINKCYVAFFTWLAGMAIFFDLGENKKENITVMLIELILVGIALYWIRKRKYSKRCKCCSILFSIVASFLIVLARSFYLDNSWDLVFGSAYNLKKALGIMIGYTVVIYHTINAVFEWLLPKMMTVKKVKLNFCMCMAALVIAWLPYVVIFYPANFCLDAKDEIAQVLGDADNCRTDASVNYPEGHKTLINNHHPVAYTLLVGGFAKLGMSIGNINFGIFLLAMLQMLCIAAIYSYTVCYIKRLGVPRWLVWGSLGFFMLFPLIPLYAITITKDSLFGGFIILVTIGLFKLIRDEEQVFSSLKEKIGILFSCIGLTLFRNNGIYILFLIILVLLIRYRKSKRKLGNILFMIGIPIVLYSIVLMKIVFPLCKIPQGSKREMLSIPFQHVARYVVEWGTDGLEEEEVEKLDTILQFEGDISVLQSRYNPIKSDKVKWFYNKDATSQDIKEFFGVWFTLFTRHPETYLEATLNNVYELYSIDYNQKLFYNGIPTNAYYYGLESPQELKEARKTVANVIDWMSNTKVVRLLFSVGPWDYMFLVCILFVIYKKKYQYLILTMPVVINVLICVAGPICYMRYAMEWIVSFPLFAAMVCCSIMYASSEKIEEVKTE